MTILILTLTFQHMYVKILEKIHLVFHLQNNLFRELNNSEVLHRCAEMFYSTVQLVQTHNFLEMFVYNSDAMPNTKVFGPTSNLCEEALTIQRKLPLCCFIHVYVK